MLITHTDTDPFNPDHPVAYAAVDRARTLAAGAGVASAFTTIKPPAAVPVRAPPARAVQLHPDDVRRHHLGVGRKLAAMGEMKAQQYLQTYYAQRGEQRGNHARRASGDPDVRYGESFQRVLPQVVDEL